MWNRIYVPGEIKIEGDNRTFTAYGNVKNVIDHAKDIAMDGCYENSIKEHIKNGTSPRLLWSHMSWDPPVGKIQHMEEDSKGLLFRGKLSNTPRGNEIYELAKDEAIEQFSIGYRVIRETYNASKGVTELHELDIKEISFVNFACNEESTLQNIKAALANQGVDDGKIDHIMDQLTEENPSLERLKTHPLFNPNMGAIKNHPLFN